MALVRYAEGQQRSGSIGASTYSHNRYGQYLRARSTPVNPNTSRQTAVRAAMAGLMIAWQTALTDLQRLQWQAYAAVVPWLNHLGDVVHLTGLSHYLRSNSVALQAGLARIDDGPTVFNVGDPEGALAGGAAETGQLGTVIFDDTADWCAEDGAAELFYLGLPQNASRNFFGGPWRFAQAVLGDSTTPPTSPVALPTLPWPVAEGQRIWIYSRILRADGRLSYRAESQFLCFA